MIDRQYFQMKIILSMESILLHEQFLDCGDKLFLERI